MRVVIKVGTQSILTSSGAPVLKTIRSLTTQIAFLKRQGHEVLLVSSGAVCLGRGVAQRYFGKAYGTSLREKQVLASLGQHSLINIYCKLFLKHNYLTSQILVTRHDFETRQHSLNILELVEELLRDKHIIPIINENDAIAIAQCMFLDNDELSGLIAEQIKADKLVILTNTDGVYNQYPDNPEAKVIRVIDPSGEWPDISTTKSTHGRGGMVSKLSTAKKMSQIGVVTHIASVNHEDVLNKIVKGEQVGTTILALPNQQNKESHLDAVFANPIFCNH
ncbi:glutamate 5-kinase [Rickettsiales endosymbiont of Peranema trichophorum]|uniref:glutamate 5-kinase n=1 Tax=Rickettsiales endosymbiont of Peranema trichophorum TaxID=2486577 RepID=UPI0013EE4F10|nr:glutamate 5-kinase [Rickettsiales endosymbiont of Peranema trichophorum]